MDEPGIGAEPAHQIVDLLVALHRRAERGAALRRGRERRELALIGGLEGRAGLVDLVEIALDRRIVDEA